MQLLFLITVGYDRSRIGEPAIHKPYYPHDSIYIISQRWEKINAFFADFFHH